MTLAVRGGGSAIVKALAPMVDEEILHVGRDQEMPTEHNRYLFCAGVLRPKREADQTDSEINEGYRVNFRQVAEDCNRLFLANSTARICVIGSESAYRGSYDDVYSRAKRLLHDYVELRKLGPDQQLVCISPSMIEDAGMTARRGDKWRIDERMAQNPKRRLLTAIEVARLVHFVLYIDQGYLNSVVIRLNGGEHNATGAIHAS